MGTSSSSCNASSDGKFIKIGEELIGEEEKTFTTVNIYKFRFLKTKVIDRIIVQLRIEVKVGNLIWTILRSMEDFRQLKDSLNLPAGFSVPFPKIVQQYFPRDREVLTMQKMLREWMVAAARVGMSQPPMLTFLGVMDAEINETAATKIDFDTLISTCGTGDLLLFETHGFIPNSIRKITSSKYDHVGVIIVKELDRGGREECFLEASGDQYGVNLHDLRKRLHEWYLADAKICYRRLNCIRDVKFHIRTNDFVNKVQGLKYGWSIKALMLNKKDKQPANKTKFFCSELVTAFYKHLGFIQSYRKCHNYMPGDFAEKESGSRLNLADAILEHEILVTMWAMSKSKRIKPMAEGTRRRRSLSQQDCLTLSCHRGTVSNSKSSKKRKSGRRSLSMSDISIIRVETRARRISYELSDGCYDDYLFKSTFDLYESDDSKGHNDIVDLAVAKSRK